LRTKLLAELDDQEGVGNEKRNAHRMPVHIAEDKEGEEGQDVLKSLYHLLHVGARLELLPIWAG
jgi:hypothetical protein